MAMAVSTLCHPAAKSFHLSCNVLVAQLLAAAITLWRLSAVASGAQYSVGDAVGWGLGNDLQSWASQLKFQVGDDLYFSYPAGQHSVLLVTEGDYKSCNIQNPISSDNGEGDMAMTLLSQQTYFFICGVPGHCEQGLRLSVVVEPPAEAINTAPPKEDDDPKQNTQGLAPPYYSKYNNFHRNSSPQLTMNALACAAALIFSIACTVALP